ncbi:hypothetical protein KC19_9G110000 [Ceratodon purpureus]|uniref:Uncharacterized protein n=1 Tax=Ceratodon purpureus TaxID=3225 RepID=A0A8T0GWB7_CERPU|nr:hypothetical protein KC19_9G110000 [Ceratodon purpureus]
MSKPNSPKSPKSPKVAKEGGEKAKAFDLGELMQRLDEAVAKTIEDFSELFVTNVQEQRSVLEDCRDYIDKLGRENADMVQTFKIQESQAFALQEVQTEEIAEHRARIALLEAELAQKNIDMEELHVHYRIEMRKIIEEERVKRRQQQIKFGARVEELHNRLESVKTFIQRQDEVEETMEACVKERDETRRQMADLEPGYERKYIEKCLAYKELTDKKLAEFMEKVKDEVGERINDRVKEVLTQNEVLLSEIYMHSSSTTGLQSEINQLTAQNTKLRCECDIKHQAEGLYVQRSNHHKHVNRHNDSKKLKSVVLQKAQELKKFRHLAEIVIRQRGEVELFLVDSIQYVKNQIYLKKKIQSYQTQEKNHSGTFNNSCSASLDSSEHSRLGSALPPINNHQRSFVKAPASWPGTGPWPRFKNPELDGHKTSSRSENNSFTGEQYITEDRAEAQIKFLDSSHDPFTVPVILPMIDISELSWEDREKVLRYLFKKINTARNQSLEVDHTKKTQAVGGEQEKYHGYVSEAERTIV